MKRTRVIATIVGARPQFIKAAAVSRAIAQHNAELPDRPLLEKIIHTGQHYHANMSQVFFDELDVPQPDTNLGVGSGPHGAQTGHMLKRIEEALMRIQPQYVLVYGDTNSTLAGALAAGKLHIPVAHVEAGLRSFNRRMSEEINRVLTDHVSDLLFCPTKTAVKNLAKEGIRRGVHLVGDVMYDCALHYAKRAEVIEAQVIDTLNLRSKSYYLATVHRAENTDDTERLRRILEAFGAISSPVRPTVFPVHPRTQKCIAEMNLTLLDHVRLLAPVSYLTMVVLEKNAAAILTDSGGVQKEAHFYRVPCITLREETEWPETLNNACNALVPISDQLKRKLRTALQRNCGPWKMMFGCGTASQHIVRILLAGMTAGHSSQRRAAVG
jgi:UDP-N-acetylglucosamine 2-epimerase